jgi:hypothetical protein
MIKRGSGPDRTTTGPAPGGSLFDRRRWVSIQAAPTRRGIDLVDSESPDFFREREEIWQKMFRSTAGRLRAQSALTGELGDELEKAVVARNLLAHHYLRDPFLRAAPAWAT